MGKIELIEAFALVYKEDNYPPVAGKILGLFFISNEKHLTFESIMDGINASKSATSKALNFLINLEEVSFIYSEKNKRKRLFHINPDGIITRLENDIFYGTKCKIRFIYVGFNSKRKKWGKKMDGNLCH